MMRNVLKVICLMLVFCLLVPMEFGGCAATPSAVTTVESTQETAPQMLTLLENGRTDYTIVYAQQASTLVSDAVADLCASFTERFGVAPEMTTDQKAQSAEAMEILVGLTNRSASSAAMETVGENAFLIESAGNSVVIVAATDALLVEALRSFEINYIASANNQVQVPVQLCFRSDWAQNGAVTNNPDGTVTLQLKHFVVTYDKSNKQKFVPEVAKAFASRAVNLYGALGAAEDQSVNQYEILFGTCVREEFTTTDQDFMFRDFYLQYREGKLSVSAFSIYGYEQAINFLLSNQGEVTIPAAGMYCAYDYGTGSFAELYKNYENPKMDGAWMLSICHRGDITTNRYPENSIPSYQSCLDLKIDIIETDLRQTQDGVWVICHDAKLDRTTTGTGSISSMTYQQTQEYFLMTQNGGKGAEVTEYKIPTLAEIIDLCRDQTLFNLDKLSPENFQSVYDVFEAENAVHMAMFKTGDWTAKDLIAWFCELLQDGRELPLFSPLSYNSVVSASEEFQGLTSMIETGRTYMSAMLIRVSACGIRPMCLTALKPELENTESWTELKNKGYTAIMTDSPVQLQEFLRGN